MSVLAQVSIILPGKVLEELKRRAESEGKSLEELIGEAVLRETSTSDPAVKAELHLMLCEKYLNEAKKFLEKKHYVQASEKAWGAASQIVKAIAASRNIELRSHGELYRFIMKLVREKGDDEIRRLWLSAITLHQNFYENWLPPEMVKENIKDVEKFVEKLKAQLKK